MDFDFDPWDYPICCNCKYEANAIQCSCKQRSEDITNGCEKIKDGVFCCYFDPKEFNF